MYLINLLTKFPNHNYTKRSYIVYWMTISLFQHLYIVYFKSIFNKKYSPRCHFYQYPLLTLLCSTRLHLFAFKYWNSLLECYCLFNLKERYRTDFCLGIILLETSPTDSSYDLSINTLSICLHTFNVFSLGSFAPHFEFISIMNRKTFLSYIILWIYTDKFKVNIFQNCFCFISMFLLMILTFMIHINYLDFLYRSANAKSATLNNI